MFWRKKKRYPCGYVALMGEGGTEVARILRGHLVVTIGPTYMPNGTIFNLTHDGEDIVKARKPDIHWRVA